MKVVVERVSFWLLLQTVRNAQSRFLNNKKRSQSRKSRRRVPGRPFAPAIIK